jgi:hypothetical protein
MKQHFLYWLVFAWPFFASSQTEAGLDIHSGFGLNPGPEFYFGNEVKSKGMISQLGIHFEFACLSVRQGQPTQKRVELETGLSVKYIRTNGQIGTSYFTYRTLRLLIPAGIKFNFTPKWNGSMGCHFQNNRDFAAIFAHQPFNFRFDPFFQIAYQPSALFSFSVRYQHTLAGPDSTYFINDPQRSILCGLTCYLKSRKAE